MRRRDLREEYGVFGCVIDIFIAGYAYAPWGPYERYRGVIGGEGSSEGVNACSEGVINGKLKVYVGKEV